MIDRMLRNFLFFLTIAGLISILILNHYVNKPLPPSPPTIIPAYNPYLNTIAGSGIVEALEENVAIGVPIPGLVTDVFVKVGDKVKEGDPLFELDGRDLEADLAVQKSNIGVQEATLVRLEDQLSRLESVKDPRAISQDEIKTRKNDVRIAKAQVEKSTREMKKTEALIERLTVRAPRDGEILQKNIRKGEYASTTPTEPAIILGDVRRFQVRVDIDEQNASRFRKDMPAVAYPKNNTELAIPLTFSRVEPYVIPKKSLTGSSEERVDTRVLQIIYTFEKPKNFNIYVGQQVDVFIKAD